jgi:hypothetical protein
MLISGESDSEWLSRHLHQNSQNQALQPSTQKHLGSVVTCSFVPAERNRSGMEEVGRPKWCA